MKIEVNFEYQGKVIPIMVDESLIHLNNLTNMVCVKPKILDKKKHYFNWKVAYDYLEYKCLEEFIKHTKIDEVFVASFLTPKKEDKSGLRVEILDL